MDIRMEVKIKDFSELTTLELYNILKVRSQVFVVEQNCVYQDLDDVDQRSLHVFYERDGKIMAYLRLFYADEEAKMVQMGRVLTLERGTGMGRSIIKDGIRAARRRMQAESICLEAQTYAIGFYEKAGFRVVSEEFLEDGIPHVKMLRELKNG